MKQQIKRLEKLRSCKEAMDFVKKHNSWQAAWDACERGDWMLRLLGRLSGSPRSESRKKLVLTACKCARLVWNLMLQEGKVAVGTAEKWAKGDKSITLNMVLAAADAAADAAAEAAAFDFGAQATYIAACAADAAAYAADAAEAAAEAAAYAAEAAAYAAADAGVRKETLKKCAIIIRRKYPKAPVL